MTPNDLHVTQSLLYFFGIMMCIVAWLVWTERRNRLRRRQYLLQNDLVAEELNAFLLMANKLTTTIDLACLRDRLDEYVQAYCTHDTMRMLQATGVMAFICGRMTLCEPRYRKPKED